MDAHDICYTGNLSMERGGKEGMEEALQKRVDLEFSESFAKLHVRLLSTAAVTTALLSLTVVYLGCFTSSQNDICFAMVSRCTKRAL
jgi:hypothetical protein